MNTIDRSLNFDALNMSVPYLTAMSIAAETGFDAIDPDLAAIAELGPDTVASHREALGLRWGVAMLPIRLHDPTPQFLAQLQNVSGYASFMAELGITATTTCLQPFSNERSYVRNFMAHGERISILADVLAEVGARIGLEYVGPRSARVDGRFPFVSSLPELLELVSAVGRRNVGVFLDAFHWFCAGDGLEDLRELDPLTVVGVDLNDAVLELPRTAQLDGRRRLPCATGMVDIAGFVGVLKELGFRGPAKAEPFDEEIARLAPEQAAARTLRALDEALGVDRGNHAGDGSGRLRSDSVAR